MYQHIWFNNRNYTEDIIIDAQKPENWIKPTEIEGIVPMCWCEHCLECAVPLCYNNCENWVERIDKKCQKSHYGTRLRIVEGRNCAQLKFRKWGKLESPIYSGCVDIATANRMYSHNIQLEKIAMSFSKPLKMISPTYKLCGAQHVFRDRYLRRVKSEIVPDTFLIQCYSPCKKPYNLLVEFYTPSGVFYRNSMLVSEGYNQAAFDINGLDLKIAENSRAKIYPENNVEEEILFFYTDFVKMNSDKRESSSKLKPASKVKCVAWDLDNTLWNGILIESEHESLELRAGVLDTIKALDERGIIQIVVSKNELEPVEQELKRLGIYEWFVYVCANWNPKSDNIRMIADWLNINVNTFALIDDSSFERGEVSENLPCVRTFNETQIQDILSLPEFDVPVTQDGKNRRIMYQTEAKRKSLQEKYGGSIQDFLRSCELVITIENTSEENFLRSYELVQRTNQLNLSGRKYSKEAFSAMLHAGIEDTYAVKAYDKYGDYGQVGFLSVKLAEESLVVSEYVMSCRVAGKWLEPALIQWLANKYSCKSVVFEGVDSKKNGLLIRTLQEFGLDNHTHDTGKLYLEIAREKIKWEQVVTVVDKSMIIAEFSL